VARKYPHPEFKIINLRQKKKVPDILRSFIFLEITDTFFPNESNSDDCVWLNNDTELSSEDIVQHFFHGDTDAILKLICFLVDQDLERHFTHLQPSERK
ncbi:hypothetical protein Bpfe_012390, partial [Biomphalaria pfeifferi]